MKKNVYLITGPSGSGKSALAEYLASQGQISIDIDSTPGLCYFVNKVGKPVPFQAQADAAWWLTHSYVWELDRLTRYLDALEPTDQPIFLCGNAANIRKAWDMFKGAYYLDIPKDVMLVRIAGANRANSFGQRVEEQDQLVRWVDDFKAEMLEAGAVTIDATAPLKTVAADILVRVKAATPSA